MNSKRPQLASNDSLSESTSSVASMLFSCPDRHRVIANLVEFFSTRGLNVSRYIEYADDGRSFSRLEWPITSRWETEEDFSQEFQALAKRCQADFQIHFANRVQTLGLFVSEEPHTLIDLLNRFEAGYFHQAEISFIVGNEQSMQKIADRHGVPFFYIPTKGVEQADYERTQLGIIQRYKPDYLGLARYKELLSTDFIGAAACPIINIHHSFLPSFTSAEPYQEDYERGVKLIGATSYFVSSNLEQGPIIEQDVQRVKAGDGVQDLIKMGRDLEQRVFALALLKVLEHKVMVYKNRTIVFD